MNSADRPILAPDLAGAIAHGGLDRPQGVAVDGGGNVYVADTSYHRIQKIELA